jgi:hypothetical protein
MMRKQMPQLMVGFDLISWVMFQRWVLDEAGLDRLYDLKAAGRNSKSISSKRTQKAQKG